MRVSFEELGSTGIVAILDWDWTWTGRGRMMVA